MSLEKINSPEDLRRLRLDELQDVAEEIRHAVLTAKGLIGVQPATETTVTPAEADA